MHIEIIYFTLLSSQPHVLNRKSAKSPFCVGCGDSGGEECSLAGVDFGMDFTCSGMMPGGRDRMSS